MPDHTVHSHALRRWEARFWTGPVAHLVAGALDVTGALSRHLLGRAAARAGARLRRRGGSGGPAGS